MQTLRDLIKQKNLNIAAMCMGYSGKSLPFAAMLTTKLNAGHEIEMSLENDPNVSLSLSKAGMIEKYNSLPEAAKEAFDYIERIGQTPRHIYELKPKSKYIRLAKAGGYKAKDGSIKKPIFINHLPHALRADIE